MTEPLADNQTNIVDIQLQAIWPEDLAAQAQIVNQCVFTFDQDYPDVVYMLLGHAASPLWLSPEVAAERVQQFGTSIAIQPRGSFVIGRKRAEEIWQALGRHLGKLPSE